VVVNCSYLTIASPDSISKVSRRVEPANRHVCNKLFDAVSDHKYSAHFTEYRIGRHHLFLHTTRR
jgi:hypothetical protein